MNLTTICSVGLAATVLVCGMDVFCAATAKKRLYASDIVWAVLFAGVQAFVFVWSAQGLVEADEGALMLMSVVVLDIACLAAAHLSLSRRAASSRLMLAAAPSDWTAYRVVSVFVALTALAAAAALCVLAVELPHNFALEQVNAKTVFVEWELLYAALVGLYFLGQRHAVLPSLVPVASMGIGVAEHFVFLFKGQPIQPGDMLAIGTAAAVSDGYVYTLSAQCLWGLTAGVAALLVCVVLAPFRRRPEHFSDACFSPAHRNAGILANAIAGAAVLACIVSNVTGGGTTNTEFEFLTGCSMANFGPGVYPYTVYDLSRAEGLPRQFSALGYATTAMHPQIGTNWNRVNAYSDLGFDRFLTIEDFEGSDTLRGHVTDRATYDKVLDVLASGSEPQFIFDVTMQNHSGYDTGLLGEEDTTHLSIDGADDPLVDEYVSLIRHSDEDLEYFIERLRELDRPVVLVFFGDHQPYLTQGYNDLWYPGEDAAEHARRVYQTDYVVWANYDITGCDQVSEVDDVSASFLASEVAQLIGAPLTSFQKAHIELRRALPEISAACYEDAAGGWFLPNVDCGIDATDQARADFATMQFYDLFRDGQGIYSSQLQDEPNVDPVAR